MGRNLPTADSEWDSFLSSALLSSSTPVVLHSLPQATRVLLSSAAAFGFLAPLYQYQQVAPVAQQQPRAALLRERDGAQRRRLRAPSAPGAGQTPTTRKASG